jgi:hypothetical protein
MSEMIWGVIVVNVMGVIFRLTFTWLPSGSNCMTDQWFASSFEILRIHSQNVLFVLCQVTRDGIDGTKVDDCGVD